MNKVNKVKAHKYFIEKYGKDYTNLGYLMSFGYSTLPRIIRYSYDLSSEAKICYETLTDMMLNTTDTIPWLYYPSQKRIALLSGIRREQANRALRELENANLIGSKRQGLGKQNIYCLLSPQVDFVENAKTVRSILNLISRDEISWDNIADNGEIVADDPEVKKAILAKIDAEKSMVMPDVSNNAHQEVIGKNRVECSDDTTEGQKSQSHQEVIGENSLQPMLSLPSTPFSQKQELTSVEVTSDELNNISSCDFKNHDTKPKFSSYRKQLKSDKLKAFELIADNLDKVVGKTLLELVNQSPQAVKSAYQEMIDRNKTHFSYFTKIFFSHLQKKSTGRRQKSIDYKDIDEELYR